MTLSNKWSKLFDKRPIRIAHKSTAWSDKALDISWDCQY